jgi:hypothetical protein
MKLVISALLVCVCTAAQAQTLTSKPKVPPGVDPGGVAIAIIGSGLDYTDPEIARRLARDGEGEIIGWDLVDGDNRPYSRAGGDVPADGSDGTHLVKMLLSTYAHARLVPVRMTSLDPPALAQAIRFVMRTPARIVALPVLSAATHGWLRQRAEQASQMLFIAATSDEAMPGAGPLRATPGNLVTVAAAGQAHTTLVAGPGAAELWIASREPGQHGAPINSAEAVVITAALAGCAQDDRQTRPGSELKADLLALTQLGISQRSGRRFIAPECPVRAQKP